MDDFIRKSGSQAYQLPAELVISPTTIPLNGPCRRVLAWILWDVARQGLWPAEEEPAPIRLRHYLADIRAGAGLEGGNDYRSVTAALATLAQARYVFSLGEEHVGFPILQEVTRLRGHFVEYVVSSFLADRHQRPLDRYALLNLEQIRELQRPLDFLVYERACLVARMRHPQFTMGLWDLAMGIREESASWTALRRPFLGACQRVAAVVEARFRIEAWCSGEAACLDTFRIMPRRLADRSNSGLRRRPRALLFEVDATGSRRLA